MHRIVRQASNREAIGPAATSKRHRHVLLTKWERGADPVRRFHFTTSPQPRLQTSLHSTMSDPLGQQPLEDGVFEDEILGLLLDENLDESGRDEVEDGDVLEDKVVEADENNSDDEEMEEDIEDDGLALPESPEDGESGPYDVTIKNKKSCAEGVWIREKGLVRITNMRGKFWRVMGFSMKSQMYLNPEEALLLVEQAQLILKAANSRSDKHIPSSYFYQEVLNFVPQAVVLSYVKLKSLDYIVLRHRNNNGDHAKPLRSFSCEYDVYEYMKANPSWNVLETCVAFDVYCNVSSWSKKAMLTNSEYAKIKRIPSRVGRSESRSTIVSDATIVTTKNTQKKKKAEIDGTGRNRLNEADDHGEEPQLLTSPEDLRSKLPKAYVIVQTGDWTFSGRLMIALLKAAKGVPLIFAAVLPSGNLILEEFTDARTSLNWENDYAIDIKYSKKTTMQTVMPKEMVERMEQERLKQEAKAAAKAAKAITNGEAIEIAGEEQKEQKKDQGEKEEEEEEEQEEEEKDDVSEEEEQHVLRTSKRTRAASKAIAAVPVSKRKRRKTTKGESDEEAGF